MILLIVFSLLILGGIITVIVLLCKQKKENWPWDFETNLKGWYQITDSTNLYKRSPSPLYPLPAPFDKNKRIQQLEYIIAPKDSHVDSSGKLIFSSSKVYNDFQTVIYTGPPFPNDDSHKNYALQITYNFYQNVDNSQQGSNISEINPTKCSSSAANDVFQNNYPLLNKSDCLPPPCPTATSLQFSQARLKCELARIQNAVLNGYKVFTNMALPQEGYNRI